MKKLCFAALLLTACTGSTQVPIKTLDDVAHEACEVFFAKQRGISLTEAAAAFCATEDQLRPFIQALRAAGKRAEGRTRTMVQ